MFHYTIIYRPIYTIIHPYIVILLFLATSLVFFVHEILNYLFFRKSFGKGIQSCDDSFFNFALFIRSFKLAVDALISFFSVSYPVLQFKANHTNFC